MMVKRIILLFLACVLLSLVATSAIAENTPNPASDFKFSNGTIQKYIGTDPTVVIPSAIDGKPVTTIGNYAFNDCTTLEVVEIPTSVTSIGNYAFRNCSLLTKVIFRCELPSMGSGSFSGKTHLAVIGAPHNEVEAYKSSYLNSLAQIFCNEHGDSCQVAITVVANPSAGGIVEGGGIYDKGQAVTLTATPHVGYTFDGWDIDDETISTNPYSFTAKNSVQATALFSLNEYDINVNASQGGNVSGNGIYSHGDSVTLTAMPDTGYTFAGWQINGQIVDTNTAYSFAATENVTVTALFTLNAYVVTVTASKGGKVQGGGSYNHGDTVALTATPDDGYSFAGWYINDQLVGMDAAYSFTATENVTLNAMFEKIPITVLPNVNDLPKTGDDSNVILWSALACISVISMMTLVRKRKEA